MQYRCCSLSLLRDALMRAKLTKDPALIVDVSFDLADVCFRHHHLTKEAKEILSDAFALSNSGGSAFERHSRNKNNSLEEIEDLSLSTQYPFDPHTVGDIGRRIAVLSYSRRDYLSAKRWSSTAIHALSQATRMTLRLRLLRNELNRLYEHSEGRLERNRLYAVRKAQEEEAERQRLLIEEKIRLGILHPDGSDPIALAEERLRRKQERMFRKRRKREQLEQEQRERDEMEKRALDLRRPKSAASGTRRKRKKKCIKSNSSVTSSVALEGRRPRTSPLSSLSKRPMTAGEGRSKNGSPLSKSAWFRKKETRTIQWDQTIDQRERRGRRLQGGKDRGGRGDTREREMSPDNSNHVFTSPRVDPAPVLSPIDRVRKTLYIETEQKKKRRRARKRPKTAQIKGTRRSTRSSTRSTKEPRAKSATATKRRSRSRKKMMQDEKVGGSLLFVPVPVVTHQRTGVFNQASVDSIHSEGMAFHILENIDDGL